MDKSNTAYETSKHENKEEPPWKVSKILLEGRLKPILLAQNLTLSQVSFDFIDYSLNYFLKCSY